MNIKLYDGIKINFRIVVISPIATAWLFAENRRTWVDCCNLDSSEGTDLVVICNVVFMSDVH